jgi:membrane dipeptidase
VHKGEIVMEEKEFQDILIVDLHCDMLSAARRQKRQIGVRSSVGHADIPRLLEGDVNLVLCALFVEPGTKENMLLEVLQQIADFYSQAADYSEKFTGIVSQHDLDKIKAREITGGLLMLEGADSLGDDLDNLVRLYRLGVRGVTLTWNGRNAVADGCLVQNGGHGLTEFGKDFLRVMEELGMLIDVSHISEKAFWDVLDIVKGPIIASHSNVKRLCAHARNLSDEQLHALATIDGVIGITFVPEFVSEDASSIEHVVDHIDYLCKEIGVRHVAIGSDFDGIDYAPVGALDATEYSILIKELMRRGYDMDAIRAIMGENALRVLSCVLT